MIQAKAGQDYHYQMAAIRSLGDLRTHVVGQREIMKYWDIEQPRYRIEQGPTWLKIDEATGHLSGRPVGPGKFNVVVAVILEKENELDPALLQWGIEKVDGTGTDIVGSSTKVL